PPPLPPGPEQPPAPPVFASSIDRPRTSSCFVCCAIRRDSSTLASCRNGGRLHGVPVASGPVQDPVHERDEARVIAQLVERRVDRQQLHLPGPLFVRLFEKIDCPVPLAEGEVPDRSVPPQASGSG